MNHDIPDGRLLAGLAAALFVAAWGAASSATADDAQPAAAPAKEAPSAPPSTQPAEAQMPRPAFEVRSPAGATVIPPLRRSAPEVITGATHRVSVHGTLSFESAGVGPSGGCGAVQVRVFRRAGGESVSTVRAVGGGMQCSYALSFPHPTMNLSELDIDATQTPADGVRVEWSKQLTGWSDRSDTKTVNFTARRVEPEPGTSTKPGTSTSTSTSTKPSPGTGPRPGKLPDLAITYEDNEPLGSDMLMLHFRIRNSGPVSAGVRIEALIGRPCAAVQGAKGDWGHLEFLTLPAPIIPGGSLYLGYQLTRYVGRGCTVRAVITPFKNGKPVTDADPANNTVDAPTPKEQRADLALDTHPNGGQLFLSVKNVGDAPSTPTKLVYDCVGDETACKPAKHSERDVPALAPGAWYLSDIVVNLHPKSWRWTAVVDPENTVVEWDHAGNNRLHSK